MIKLYEHNSVAYTAVKELLAVTRKACVVHPTGTGKSFIAFKWIEDNPEGRFIWLGPSEYIFSTQLENVKKLSAFEPKNIRFLTYNRLMRMSAGEIAELKPTHLVLDEFHRVGAERWEDNVLLLIQTFEKMQVLGLSATPVRYLDNQRDMAAELFDGCIADYMTLGEAIVRKILPTPKYVVSLYTINEKNKYEKELQHYCNRIRRSSMAVRKKAEICVDRLRRELENADGLDKVFAKHLKRGKYIVFCANVENLQDMVKKTPEWFGTVDSEAHVYTVWANSTTAKADYAMFQADKSDHLRLMFCVDMFNEGIHVDGLDGVILFRPTISPIIYKQQIGRALSVMKDKTPLIIDAVNNFDNLYSISSVQAEIREIGGYYSNKHNDDNAKADSFQIIDEVRECRQLINELEETLSLSWDTMYSIAKAYFNEHGNLLIEKRYRTPDGVPLGQWITTQRNVYNGNSAGILNEYRIKQLNEIGMIWGYTQDIAWERGYSHFTDYIKENGNTCVPARFVCEDGFRLGNWIGTQRTRYAKRIKDGIEPLNDDRLNRLNMLGMIWDPTDVAFEKGLSAAKDYAKEYGNLEVPTKYITADGFKLGLWLRRMKLRHIGYKNHAPLSQAQIERLENVGMKWQNEYEKSWESSFSKAESYFMQHGHLVVPPGYSIGEVDLYRWLQRQAQKIKRGNLSDDHIRRLKAIGFSLSNRIKSWNDHYAEAQAYFEQYGDLEVPANYIAPNGTWLGKWISLQRLDRKRGIMSEEQVNKLNTLSMRWEDINKKRWYEQFEQVKNYPKSVNGLPIVPDNIKSKYGTKLKDWVKKQNAKYGKGLLDTEQRKCWEQMLSGVASISFSWEDHQDAIK